MALGPSTNFSACTGSASMITSHQSKSTHESSWTANATCLGLQMMGQQKQVPAPPKKRVVKRWNIVWNIDRSSGRVCKPTCGLVVRTIKSRPDSSILPVTNLWNGPI